MRILVTNDDGIHADGLRTLVSALKPFGEVKVAAPDRERSACGHSMTMRDPLRVTEHEVEGCEAIAVNGVPVDCVNVGLTVLYPSSCDVVVSGINHGPNLGFDVTYSGTVAGAMEGAINGIKSFAFSMALITEGAPLHLASGGRWVNENFERLATIDLPEHTFLNVNIPSVEFDQIEGEKFVGMGKRIYEDRVEFRSDPWGRAYYWQGGVVVMRPDKTDTDVWAVTNNFVSITPVRVDWTCLESLAQLQKEYARRT